MITKIKVSGFEEIEKLSLKDEKRELLNFSRFYFSRMMERERENVMLRLVVKFKSLRYEDLEEIYSDGCLVLWNKMMDKDFKLKEKGLVGYLVKICMNIGMHYLRKVNLKNISLDSIWENEYVRMEEEDGMKVFYDVLDEGRCDDEVFEKLDKAYEKLKEVDKMILESYYVDGCKMEEIAKRIGYRNGNSVKSRKNKVIRKMMEMMKEGKEDFKHLPQAA